MSTDGRTDAPDTEALLRRVIDILNGCRTLPLSSSVRLDNRDEVIELLEEASQRLPDELKQARWLLRERTEFLEKRQREADDILEAARVRAEGMVQRTEIVRESEHAARRTVDDARDEARRLRHEAEDYCDQKLAAFEIVLERTIKTVQAGRDKLSVIPPPPADGPEARVAGVEAGDDTLAAEDSFFDQDRH
jgi:regulator of protease activity HflC (stomatin/prohibitin superfamily)